MADYSVSPSGEKFPIPDRAGYTEEMAQFEGVGCAGPL